ncbi:SpoIIE family protein phosphatase [Sulfidibacter corallicola]|uniref:SpoIIE family protein phosphatase n=1 Tax=Sulfidibacter corallicola TaxID=2818388 RepID=A0A8A4TY41_SULCO|nr:SpoIIE family protein phosphatase [Sulfidibacter corallicola]QTD51445.1 SpoIIE family protein phosphatase [Sulfidibacter corallicola]
MALSRILIVEDTPFPRAILQRQLMQMGYEVIAVADGTEAWEVMQNEPINFVITDWLMPRMSGIELCRRIRREGFSRYVYIILLTAKGDKNDLIAGLEAGADDFMVKPCNPLELKVKVLAGERVLKYEKTLVDQNRKLELAHQQISEQFATTANNLKLAAKFQKALLPMESATIDQMKFESMFVPCEVVAGDFFNFFKINEEKTAFFLLDVAGHGIPAAMLSFTLSHVISPLPFPPDAQHLGHTGYGFLDFTHPTHLASRLNQIFEVRSDGQQYFTMVYGVIDLAMEQVLFTQAGHPPIIYLPYEGEPCTIGEGGFPMGIFPNTDFDIYSFDFRPGDRLYLYSDGVTGCFDPDGQSYSTERFMDLLAHHRRGSLREGLVKLKQALIEWRGSDQFEDDLSVLAVERLPDPSQDRNHLAVDLSELD